MGQEWNFPLRFNLLYIYVGKGKFPLWHLVGWMIFLLLATTRWDNGDSNFGCCRHKIRPEGQQCNATDCTRAVGTKGARGQSLPPSLQYLAKVDIMTGTSVYVWCTGVIVLTFCLVNGWPHNMSLNHATMPKTYRISANSFRRNYFFLNLTLCTVTYGYSTYRCGNYSREETIQGRKLYEEIRYPKTQFLFYVVRILPTVPITYHK